VDFTLTEQQEEVRSLAERLFQDRATVDRVKAAEASADGIDLDLWAELARTGLVGLALPEEHGGGGLGLVELCLVLEQQGRVVAPVPLLATVTAAMAIAELGSAEQRSTWLPRVAAGDAILTSGLEGSDTVSVDAAGRLSGACPCLPAGHVADAVLVAAGDGTLHLVDPAAAAGREVAVTTSRERQAHLVLDGTPAEPVGGPGGAEWLRQRAMVGLCALQVGVGEAALRLAAGYTSHRQQFGKPLSTFQGVALKAADAYIAIQAMRATMWQAAWRLAEGLDADDAVLVAKWWAADGGHRVVHAAQHLHGGMGADVDYPVHRYFLWGKQLTDTLGGASATLARLGAALA
jgi:3-oxocholest-4-en-26-oyl-CoA dehydrogenase beta subunit